jgi:hypothetical protein
MSERLRRLLEADVIPEPDEIRAELEQVASDDKLLRGLLRLSIDRAKERVRLSKLRPAREAAHAP